MQLYKIDKEIHEILANIEESEGVLTEEQEIELEKLAKMSTEKILDIACCIKNFQYQIDAYKQEKQKFEKKIKSNEKTIEYLSSMITAHLNPDIQKNNKLSDFRIAISFRRSQSLSGDFSLTKDNVAKYLPEDCYSIVENVKIDKKSITDKIKSGEKIAGYSLEEHLNLQIK